MVSVIEILLIAVGLAMDAFAVSVSNGLTMKSVKISDASKIAVFTGGFQGLFPLFGWLIGILFSSLIVVIDCLLQETKSKKKTTWSKGL